MLIKRHGKIPQDQWEKLVDNHQNIISLHEFEKTDRPEYGYAILRIGDTNYGSLTLWYDGTIKIDIKPKYWSLTYEALVEIANDVNGSLYHTNKRLFDPKLHLPLPVLELIKDSLYFDCNRLNNIKWLGIREVDNNEILKALKFQKGESRPLVGLLNREKTDTFILTSTYKGWIFIIGDDLPNVLINGEEGSTEEALTNLCKSLQKLSKRFIEVQYYEHNEKSNITGYFKANNGKLIYGYWKSEVEEFTKGRIPKELKKIHPTTAHEVASIWSIDPLDFGFIKPYFTEKSTLVTF